MALTELQLPTKTEFYKVLQNAASEINNLMARWRDLSEFIARIETVDLDAMTVPSGVIRTDLVDFRVAVNEILALYDGTATTPAKNPSGVIEKVRKIG